MELINRYVYAVTRSLPEKQRDDIEKELRTLIEDMLEQYGGPEAYEVKVQKVLLDLGDPEIMANNYRSTKRYLIGPQNFDNYILILKIVLGAVFLGLSVASAVSGVFAQDIDMVSLFTNYFGTLLSGLIEAFAWVTIIFAIAEYRGVELKTAKLKDEPWSISDLPAVPDKDASISPWPSLVAIVFSAIFMSILYFKPQLFAAYLSNGSGTTVIPVFSISVITAFKALIAIVFGLSVLKEVLKVVYGRWTMRLAVGYTALSVASTILMAVILLNPAIWNPNFTAEVMKYNNTGVDLGSAGHMLANGLILIMIAACILDVSKALYKGMKYNLK